MSKSEKSVDLNFQFNSIQVRNSSLVSCHLSQWLEIRTSLRAQEKSTNRPRRPNNFRGCCWHLID